MYSMHMNTRISYLYLTYITLIYIYIYIYVICINYMGACVYSPKTGIQRAETVITWRFERYNWWLKPATKWDVSCLIPS